MTAQEPRIDRRALKKVMRLLGNKTLLANQLGISRPTLLRYLGGLEPASKAMVENINAKLESLLKGA